MACDIDDPELAVIGAIIAAVSRGRAANLDVAAWQRISEYAASLCSSGKREAAERAQAQQVGGTLAEAHDAFRKEMIGLLVETAIEVPPAVGVIK